MLPSSGRAPARAIALVMALGAACTSSGGEPDDALGGLVHQRVVERAPASAEDAGKNADALVRAALVPHHQLAAAIGAHRFRSTSTIEIADGATVVDSFTVTSTIEYHPSGAFHALVENSKDYGREIYYVDGMLYLAPRYSKLHRRAPESSGAGDDEPARLRDEIFGDLGAYLELLASGIAVSDQGPTQHAGRAARAIAIAKAATPRQPRAEAQKQRAWRETVQVTAAEGEIVLDGESGAPLAGKLRGALTMTRDGRALTMKLSVDHAVEDIGQPVSITAPPAERWVATPLRSRELDERETLLQGIAPSGRKAPAPGGNP